VLHLHAVHVRRPAVFDEAAPDTAEPSPLPCFSSRRPNHHHLRSLCLGPCFVLSRASSRLAEPGPACHTRPSAPLHLFALFTSRTHRPTAAVNSGFRRSSPTPERIAAHTAASLAPRLPSVSRGSTKTRSRSEASPAPLHPPRGLARASRRAGKRAKATSPLQRLQRRRRVYRSLLAVW
jgi:hypothetical protein